MKSELEEKTGPSSRMGQLVRTLQRGNPLREEGGGELKDRGEGTCSYSKTGGLLVEVASYPTGRRWTI